MGSATTAGGGEYAGGDELRDAHAHERVSRPMNQRTTTVAPMPDRDHLDSSTRVIDEVGFDPMTRHEASLFFRLVSYR